MWTLSLALALMCMTGNVNALPQYLLFCFCLKQYTIILYHNSQFIFFILMLSFIVNFTFKRTFQSNHSYTTCVPTLALGYVSQLRGLPFRQQKIVDIIKFFRSSRAFMRVFNALSVVQSRGKQLNK